ncbi:hypothetical protein EBU95_21035 [bacterium]|nr:hypothetical protein [bacterium]
MKILSNKHPIKQHAYAVVTGKYAGEMLVMVGEDKDNFHFLSLPKNNNRIIPKEKFEFGLKHSIIDHVEALPKFVFKVISEQFKYNENSNNRR